MSNLSQIPIGKFSLMTQLSPKALRLYDKKGLLVPGEKDPITGYRYYTMSQVEKGVKIKMLIGFGFGLEEISRI
ncbi:MAG: MerR family transcriptional regulator, partial [Candidatus Hodarchaeota archaeon]